MRVINLYGGPGTGKSTTAAGLFFMLKQRGMKAELVTEYAKDLTYERRDLSNQLAIFSEQERRMHRLKGSGVEYVVTDSPLLLSRVYAKGIYCGPEFEGLVQYLSDTYNNYNVLLERVKPYCPIGRNETEKEALEVDRSIEEVLGDIWDLKLRSDAVAPQVILREATRDTK